MQIKNPCTNLCVSIYLNKLLERYNSVVNKRFQAIDIIF